MNEVENYIEINRSLWDAKTGFHVQSEFYNVEGFLKGATSLKQIEIDLLGDIKGKKILHLQCHFGMDTLSMARMGAKVTGIDFSEEAIKMAREMNDVLGLDATFILSDVYKLPEILHEEYDLVFTSYGVIGWLPDMENWARVAAHFVKPSGQFLIVEFHPVVWMFKSDFSKIEFSYFNREPIIETLSGTYADMDAKIGLKEIGWNHDLGEVLGNLLKSGLQIESFKEYDKSPYNCFQNTVEVEPGLYQIKGLEGKIPMVYSLMAKKP